MMDVDCFLVSKDCVLVSKDCATIYGRCFTKMSFLLQVVMNQWIIGGESLMSHWKSRRWSLTTSRSVFEPCAMAWILASLTPCPWHRKWWKARQFFWRWPASGGRGLWWRTCPHHSSLSQLDIQLTRTIFAIWIYHGSVIINVLV